MKSLASLALILAVPAAAAQEPPAGEGPRGSSQLAPGERRLDSVGAAMAGPALTVPDVPAATFVEITALGSGRTIVAATGAAGGTEVTLSPKAAEMLGLPDGGPVRVRRAVATPQETAALRQGETIARIAAPPSLLAGLRKRMQQPEATPPRVEPAPRPEPKPAPAAAPAPAAPRPSATVPAPRGRMWVQVATLSNAANARALATKLGGAVTPLGKLHRVRIGPLADRAAAERARARAVAAGYRDAAIVPSD